MCSGIWRLLSCRVIRVLCFGTDCKHSPSTGEVVSTQDEAEKKRKKAEEARWHDTPKLIVGKFERRQGGKEKYLQVILAEKISKQHLLLHVGN